MGGSPYKGLTPFEEGDWPYFRGRDVDRDLICANLIASRLTVFYGPSGVGKSSVLEAGAGHYVNQVLAAEGRDEVGRPEFALAIFRSWRDDPAAGILAAARAAAERVAGHALPAPAPSASSQGLADALEAVARSFGGSILLVLDQFEEYFNYHDGPERPGGPSDALASLLQRVRLGRGGARLDRGDSDAGETGGYPIHVMISIRDDALARLDRFQAAVPELFASTLRIEPLDRGQAELAVVKPLEEYNRDHRLLDDPYRIEPELVEQVLNGVRSGTIDLGELGRGRPTAEGPEPGDGARPEPIEVAYLQLVMARLWEEEGRRGSRVLRLSTFRELGGALGIVRHHLDKILDVLSASDRRLVADLLRYLVTPSGSKIALTVESLADFTGRPPERVVAVLGRLASKETRVLRETGESGDSPGYEIYHDVLAKVVPEYVRAREAERAAARVWKLTAIVLLLASLLALALREWWIAGRQTRLATSRLLSGYALAVRENELDLALLLSLEAHRKADTPEARNSLAVGLGTNLSLMTYLRGHTDSARCVAIDAARRRLVSCGDDGFLRSWDLDTHRPLGQVRVADGPRHFRSIAVSPDGKRLASGDKEGDIFLYDLASWPPKSSVLAHVKEVGSLAFSPDNRTLASGGGDGEVFLWDVGSAKASARRLEGQSGQVHSISFSRDGKTLASGGVGGLLLWDVATGRPLGALFQPHKDPDPKGMSYVGAVAFSPAEDRLASGGTDRKVILWTLSPDPPGVGDDGDGPAKPAHQGWFREKVVLDDPHDDSILCLAFSRDGRTLASSGWDNVIKLWDVGTARRVGETLEGHRGYVSSLAFLPDGKALASSSMDQSVILWELEPRHRLATELRGDGGPGKDALCVAVRRDGQAIATGGEGGELLLWDLAKDPPATRPVPLQGHRETVHGVAFGPDGQTMASGGGKGELFLWDLKTRPPKRRRLEGHKEDIRSLAFSRDGRTLATAGAAWQLILWDMTANPPSRVFDSLGRTGPVNLKEKGKEEDDQDEIRSVAFSPDGRMLASGGQDFRVTLWDLSGPEPKPDPLPDRIKGWVQSVAFSPDGKTLASGSWYDDVALWDVAARTRLPRLIGPRTNVGSIAFSPDGKTLASGGEGMRILLWDLTWQRCSGEFRAGREKEKSIRGVAFLDDFSLLSVAEGGAVTRWDLDFQSWIGRACAVANRNLTRDEWRSYIGPNESYRPTCPDLPSDDRGPTPPH